MKPQIAPRLKRTMSTHGGFKRWCEVEGLHTSVGLDSTGMKLRPTDDQTVVPIGLGAHIHARARPHMVRTELNTAVWMGRLHMSLHQGALNRTTTCFDLKRPCTCGGVVDLKHLDQ